MNSLGNNATLDAYRMPFTPNRRFKAAPRMLAWCAAICALSAAAPAWAGQNYGFVFTLFQHAAYDGGAADCPDGLNLGQREAYLASVSPADRERLKKEDPDHPTDDLHASLELARIIYGNMLHNRCVQPWEYPDPGMKLLQGKVAYGMNLDGKVDSDGPPAPNTCSHPKFESPTGEKGIDNQYWRTVGCLRLYRKDADVQKEESSNLHSGGNTFLAELINVDSLSNADHVEVGLYSSPDAVINDAAGAVEDAASFRVSSDPHYRNVFHGRIKDGLLTTDPTDIRLKMEDGPVDTEYYIRGARIRAKVSPDGSHIDGMLAGYYDIDKIVQFTAQGNTNGAVVAGYTCPGLYYALHRAADGYPDPKTGQCTALSSAFEFKGVTAFVSNGGKTQVTQSVVAP